MSDEDFEILYANLYAQIYGFAARRLGHEAAKDVVADTFEVAWKKRDRIPVDESKWAAWVVGIAKKKVLQESQRRKRRHHDNRFTADWTDGHEDLQPRSEDAALRVLASDAGRHAYAQLTPAERLLFDVAFVRDLTSEQAAATMSITVTAFTTRLSRLRRRIRELLDRELDAQESLRGRQETV